MKKLYNLLIFIFIISGLTAQTNNMSEIYYDFLNDNKNLSYSGSSALFPLKDNYYQAIPDMNYINSYSWLDSVIIKFNLNSNEKEMLAKNGFVVSERISYLKFVDALKDIYFKDLPVMVTSDMMLFALHASYDAILKKLELDLLRPNLIRMLENMRVSYNTLQSKYEGNSELDNSLNDVDLYISIPLALLGKTTSSIKQSNQVNFDLLLAKIRSEQGFVIMPLFSEHMRTLDFSQFSTRGHYSDIIYTPTGPDSLANYFKAMIWLGRMDFFLTPPPAFGEEPWSEKDILRMNTSALLLDELIDVSGTRSILQQNEETIDLMVGMSDNLTPTELKSIRISSGVESALDLLDSAKYKVFKNSLVTNPESAQKILSDIFMVDPFSSEPDPLPVSFRLLGQRFIIDSYFFSQLVYDNIIYQDQKIWRPLPSPLDAAFILGNNDALNLLQDELNTYKYASQLSCLRKLTDLYDSAFWQQSLYNSWLSCLRKLNDKPDWEKMPFFLSSAAWQHEKLNTQLASWAQLRHDNLLYAKQSYTGGTICSYPYSYVEPYPEFYKALSTFASRAGVFFDKINGDQDIKAYFQTMKSTCDTLAWIADKQIKSLALSEREVAFLKNMYQIQEGQMCGEVYEEGWYFDLLFDPGKEAVVADVHTQPTDEFGGDVGRILHVGTGRVNMGIFLANGPAPENKPMAFVGPVMSYYETVTSNFKRYNDTEWVNVLPVLKRPDWTSIYLVNGNGNLQEKGDELPYQLVKLGSLNYRESHYNKEVLVYPNPANDYLNTRNFSQSANIFLYDIRGTQILHFNNNQQQINLNTLKEGVYILKIVDQGLTETTRIVKE